MKIEKPSGTEITIVVFLIAFTVALILPNFFYHRMSGAEGLRNIILATSIQYVCRIIGVIPIFIADRNILKTPDIRKSKFLFFGTIFLTFIVPIVCFWSITRPRLNEQQYIKNKSSDLGISFQCISDLINDDYETFTINNCYIRSQQYISASGRGRSRYHNEYTVSFYNGNNKVTEMQIGSEEKEYLKNLPYGFDTEITVYKKSGFLRSVKPSVDFGKDESYQHFFTISTDGNKIVYEKNVDLKIKNLTWSGFKKKRNYDMKNALFGISADGEKQSLDTDMYNLCEEICLYGVVDGKYRRISNVLSKDDC